jgi:hypothetical protein
MEKRVVQSPRPRHDIAKAHNAHPMANPPIGGTKAEPLPSVPRGSTSPTVGGPAGVVPQQPTISNGASSPIPPAALGELVPTPPRLSPTDAASVLGSRASSAEKPPNALPTVGDHDPLGPNTNTDISSMRHARFHSCHTSILLFVVCRITTISIDNNQ